MMEIELIKNTKPQPKPREKTKETTIPRQKVQPGAPEEKKKVEPPITDKEIKKLLKNLKKEMQPLNRKLQFRVNKEINRIVVKVIDKNTDKVIKEIPPEEIQHMLASIRRNLGLLVDKQI